MCRDCNEVQEADKQKAGTQRYQVLVRPGETSSLEKAMMAVKCTECGARAFTEKVVFSRSDSRWPDTASHRPRFQTETRHSGAHL